MTEAREKRAQGRREARPRGGQRGREHEEQDGDDEDRFLTRFGQRLEESRNEKARRENQQHPVATVLPSATSAAAGPSARLRESGIERSIIGTTARSWRMRMPTRKRPCGESSSRRSRRSFSTMAVEESATRKPKKTARERV